MLRKEDHRIEALTLANNVVGKHLAKKPDQPNVWCGEISSTSDEDKACFLEAMIGWYENNKRSYPWREQADPYKILLSEVMLQQTNADRVLLVYQHLTQKYPNIRALAKSELEDLRVILKPLGLNYRASRLKKMAEKIVIEYNEEIPNSVVGLLALPGVGRYIANAVACFAYGKRVALIDVNVVRLYQRVVGFTSQKARPREDSTLWEFAEKMMPETNFKEFNLALIDFSASICTFRKPQCAKCPVSNICLSYIKGSKSNGNQG